MDIPATYILTAVTVKNPLFLDVARCSLEIEVYRRFRATYCFHLQGRTGSNKKTERRVMLFETEDGDNTILRSIGKPPFQTPRCHIQQERMHYRCCTHIPNWCVAIKAVWPPLTLSLLSSWWLLTGSEEVCRNKNHRLSTQMKDVAG
jgi:hypothetical protein